MNKAPLSLSMIVRDEEQVIGRCLDSVLPYITHWAIVDTGSNDKTPELIQQKLGHLPGALAFSKWTDDFSTHRNQALELARETLGQTGGNLLFIDADETLHGDLDSVPFRVDDTWRGAVQWWAHDGRFRYRKLAIAGVDIAKYWIGQRHEYLHLSEPFDISSTVSAWITYGHDGFRRRNSNTLEHDVTALSSMNDALTDTTQINRSYFYLARTLESQRKYEDAVRIYELTTKSNTLTHDEHWQAMWGKARSLERWCERDEGMRSHCVNAFLELHLMDTERAEPLTFIADVAYMQDDMESAFKLSLAAADAPLPLTSSTYDYGAGKWDAVTLLANASLHLGKKERQEALIRTQDALNDVELPSEIESQLRGLAETLSKYL